MTVVAPLPSPAPSTGNITATSGDAFVAAVQTFSVQAETARSQVASNTALAAIAASIAAAAAAAIPFNGATNYGLYGCAISTVSGQIYSRRTAGISATDPANDSIGPSSNWFQITFDPLGSPTIQTPNLIALRGKKAAVAASAIDLSAGDYFTKKIVANTTFTLSSTPSTGNVPIFWLALTNAGSFAITWWANLKWHGGAVPAFPVSGICVLEFYTYDAGTTWIGRLLSTPS